MNAPQDPLLPDPDEGDGHDTPPEVDEIAQIAFFEQAKRPLPEDDCAERACKALSELGYEGLRDVGSAVDDRDATSDATEQPDPLTAWKRLLEADGKLRPRRPIRRVVDVPGLS